MRLCYSFAVYTHFLHLKGILQNTEVTWGLGRNAGVTMGRGLGRTGWKSPTVGSPRILPLPGVTGGGLRFIPLAKGVRGDSGGLGIRESENNLANTPEYNPGS